MKAVILAAGKGTRLGSLTKEIPKPMIPVAEKPLLEHIILRLSRAGVSEFVLVTRYLAECIREYFGDGSRLGTKIQYVDQGDNYGTGAALSAASKLVRDEPFLMTFADILTTTDTYRDVIGTMADNGSSGVVTLNWVDDPFTGAAVVLDGDEKLTKIIEKPAKGSVPSHWNCAGIYIFDPAVFEYLGKLQPSWRGEYELADAVNLMLDDGLLLHPCYLQGEWLDVGTVEAIAVAEKMLGGS